MISIQNTQGIIPDFVLLIEMLVIGRLKIVQKKRGGFDRLTTNLMKMSYLNKKHADELLISQSNQNGGACSEVRRAS